MVFNVLEVEHLDLVEHLEEMVILGSEEIQVNLVNLALLVVTGACLVLHLVEEQSLVLLIKSYLMEVTFESFT